MDIFVERFSFYLRLQREGDEIMGIFRLLTLSLFLIIFLVSCSQQTNTMPEQMPEDTIHLSASLHKGYSTITELANDSQFIAKVKISDVKAEEYSRVVFTTSKAHVLKTYKGNLQSEINILETGGQFEGKSYIFANTSVFNKGDEAIVYLNQYVGPITNNAFVVTGVKGKFTFDISGKLKPANETVGELSKVKGLKDLNLQDK